MAQNRPDWMWAQALQLLDQAERAHRDMFRPSGQRRQAPCWEPPVDVFETEGEVVIVAALPGVAPDEAHAEIEGQTLIITGTRPLPCAGRRANIVRLEIPYGRFEKRIALSNRLRLAGRELRNGCLILTFAKTG